MFYYFIMGWRDREWPLSRLSQGLFGPWAGRLPAHFWHYLLRKSIRGHRTRAQSHKTLDANHKPEVLPMLLIGYKSGVPMTHSLHAYIIRHFSCVWLFATPWAVTLQSPLSMGFSRQEHWSGLSCPPPGDLPDPEVKLASLMSPTLAGRFFATSAIWDSSWGSGNLVEQLTELRKPVYSPGYWFTKNIKEYESDRKDAQGKAWGRGMERLCSPGISMCSPTQKLSKHHPFGVFQRLHHTGRVD